MKTECNEQEIVIEGLGKRQIVSNFTGGDETSDAGAVLLAAIDRRIGLIDGLADCFADYRDPARVEHTVPHLLMQRIFGIVLGYEDLNDHDLLSKDRLLAAIIGKSDPTGQDRRRKNDKGRPLAGKNTLNRLELTGEAVDEDSKDKNIVADFAKIERIFVDLFVAVTELSGDAPEEIILDFDATDDLVHGTQEGRFFHGYYHGYCYLPLYVFCGDHLLAAVLRSSNIDASAGTVDVLQRLVAQIREHWPSVRIVLRGDSGFARDEIMAWCEEACREGNDVRYILGLAKNKRLLAEIELELAEAKEKAKTTGKAARVFTEFSYTTLDSWSRERRVVAKAEQLGDKANPRFVVTSLAAEEYDARSIYEDVYCARGDMENRIKEQQLDLFADRTSSHMMRANQLRLWFSSFAYVLVSALRTLGLAGTEMARAQAGTIRTKLLKIGARIRVTVRRVWVEMASAYPYQDIFRHVLAKLRAIPLRC